MGLIALPAIPPIVEGIIWLGAALGIGHQVLPGKEEREQSIRDLGNAMAMSNAQDDAKANADSGAAVDACSTCPPPPECKNIVDDMERKNRALNKELDKYVPTSDAIGGHPYAGPGGITKFTKPGGHYKEIRDLQRGLKNDMRRYGESKCYNNAPARDKITRDAAQKGINEKIEVPPGIPFIPL
jgi:hypothetical protein